MHLFNSSGGRWALLEVFLTSLLLVYPGKALPTVLRSDNQTFEYGDDDPFAVLDPQKWVNPDNMTWADWKSPPGTNWSDPTKRGSIRNFNIALITVDYSDKPFVITQPVGSTIFNNPQPSAPNITRDTVPSFYRDYLNTPGQLNRGHTIHEYWMGDSNGRFGVDLTVFGPYQLPALSYQYGVTSDMNGGACPDGETCDIDIRTDALNTWLAAVGNATLSSYELVYVLSAGQDESSTWQEFGEMRFQTKEDVTDNFGPPPGRLINGSHQNYAHTRYVEWTSWASASTIWPYADSGASIQTESSGMATYAHELSHLLGIGDNYNNPYGVPLRRSYTGPWSMMSRGSFNGPGGPHTRWQIPSQHGGSMGSHHTMHDKFHLGLLGNESILQVSREALAGSGMVLARLTARSVSPGKTGLMGIRVIMDADNSPACDINTDLYCDGGSYDTYDVEVIDRMGADSFTPDSGVMISKTKYNSDQGPFQWIIDANPQDIKLRDFYRPDGSPAMITLGDYRQLADALFHAGTRSGSQYEFVDNANRLHLYVVDIHRDKSGVLSYTAAVRSLNSTSDPHKRGVAVGPGKVVAGRNSTTQTGVTCSFQISNTGTYSAVGGQQPHPQNVSSYLTSDVYRLNATVLDSGWKVELPNALATAEFGSSTTVKVAVAADASAAMKGEVTLIATSESNPSIVATGVCLVNKYLE